MHHFRSPLLFFCCSALFGTAQSFTFTLNEQPTQCDPLSIFWTGGQPPFRLIIVLPKLVNINMTIPDSNFQDNKGSFSVPALLVPKNTQLFFGMSDATGAVSGGTTSLMTVGDSLTRQSCNTTTPANDFFYSTENTLTQCGDFLFTKYPLAPEPLTIFAFIPGGSDSFVLPPSPPSIDRFDWKANITAQTQVTFSVIDSAGRNGGTAGLYLVAPSNDKSCLLSTSSSSISAGSSSTSQPQSTPTGSSNSGGSNQSQNPSGLLPTGAIIGIVVGGTGVAAILVTLLCWLRRRRFKSRIYDNRSIDLAEGFSRNPELPQPILSQQYAPISYPSIFMHQGMNGSVSSFHPEQLQYPPPLRVRSRHYDEDSTSSFGAATSSKPGSHQTKIVLHRDIDEAEGLIELPPQYDEHRAPILGLHQASSPLHGGQPKKG